jgi:hypothetical protein
MTIQSQVGTMILSSGARQFYDEPMRLSTDWAAHAAARISTCKRDLNVEAASSIETLTSRSRLAEAAEARWRARRASEGSEQTTSEEARSCWAIGPLLPADARH